MSAPIRPTQDAGWQPPDQAHFRLCPRPDQARAHQRSEYPGAPSLASGSSPRGNFRRDCRSPPDPEAAEVASQVPVARQKQDAESSTRVPFSSPNPRILRVWGAEAELGRMAPSPALAFAEPIATACTEPSAASASCQLSWRPSRKRATRSRVTFGLRDRSSQRNVRRKGAAAAPRLLESKPAGRLLVDARRSMFRLGLREMGAGGSRAAVPAASFRSEAASRLWGGPAGGNRGPGRGEDVVADRASGYFSLARAADVQAAVTSRMNFACVVARFEIQSMSLLPGPRSSVPAIAFSAFS
jgi:hypothetical protein